jgi:crotonobetainyl-CoA:carnitine CoA-transferase CaiB-like acyl-CoA transferase
VARRSRRAQVRCEPVWRPGEALRDAHVREIGLAVEEGEATFLGPAVRVTAVQSDNSKRRLAGFAEAPTVSAGVTVSGATGGGVTGGAAGRGAGNLLDGVRVLDLSAYLAGPVTPLILGEVGADAS